MDNIIFEYDWLIRSIAKKFYNIEKEDLYQAGCLGLIKAYNNYKEGTTSFSTYAYNYVFGEMYALSLKNKNIKMNKYYLKLYKLIIKAKNYLMQEFKRDVSLKEISDYIEVSIDEIEYTLFLMEDMLSLDDENNHVSYGIDIDYSTSIDLNDSINSLDTLSSTVMNYRYKMDMTQSEVAKILGLSQVKVSRIESSSKNKIRDYIA